jgi:hypothetical protein
MTCLSAIISSISQATLLIVKKLPSPFTFSELQVMGKSTHKNPLKQTYAFYNEESNERSTANNSVSYNEPTVICDEIAFEPELAIKVPLAYLENVRKSLKQSSNAWRKRYHLERMRQVLVLVISSTLIIVVILVVFFI